MADNLKPFHITRPDPYEGHTTEECEFLRHLGDLSCYLTRGDSLKEYFICHMHHGHAKVTIPGLRHDDGSEWFEGSYNEVIKALTLAAKKIAMDQIPSPAPTMSDMLGKMASGITAGLRGMKDPV